MQRAVCLFIFLFLISALLAGCGGLLGGNLRVETYSDLGPGILSRIDAINKTIATGVEVGPETRELIRELNQTLANGVKAGLDEATLTRIDGLMRTLEDGLKIGLDDDTLNRVDDLINTVDNMPGQWENTVTDIINELEGSAGSMAGRMADEVKGVMKEARINFQQLTASAGEEFRCNVDFLGARAGATVDEFIGHSLVGRLRAIISGKKAEVKIPDPWVCQIIPDTLALDLVGEQFLLKNDNSVITITGYNYMRENLPKAYLTDEQGRIINAMTFAPNLTSPYKIQLVLQGVDFRLVPPRSRLVFEWPNVKSTSSIAVLLPEQPGPRADFDADVLEGESPLTVRFTDRSENGPTVWSWNFGDQSSSTDASPVHEFNNLDDKVKVYPVQLVVVNTLGQSEITKNITVYPQLRADFEAVGRTKGNAPFEANFRSKSMGSPSQYLWDFGDGSGWKEAGEQAFNDYTSPGSYTVRLKVSNGEREDIVEKVGLIVVESEPKANFKMEYDYDQENHQFTVKFVNLSQGNYNPTWQWKFGDGAPDSNEESPKHTFDNNQDYRVELIMTNRDGKVSTLAQDIQQIDPSRFLELIQKQRIIQDSSPFKSGSVFYFTYPDDFANPKPPEKDGRVRDDTGISVDRYVCGVVGAEAKNGDIDEHGLSEIVKAKMMPNGNTWHIYADFRTESRTSFYNSTAADHETWKVYGMCLDREAEGDGFIYKNLPDLAGGISEHDTGVSIQEFAYCGVFGFQVYSGDIDEHNGKPVIFQATTFADEQLNTWKLRVDFATQGVEEKWKVDLLCLRRLSYGLLNPKPDFQLVPGLEIHQPEHSIRTTIPTGDYLCGVSAFSAESGDIDEEDKVDIFSLMAKPDGDVWAGWADFASHEERHEFWKLDLLCTSSRIALWALPLN